jgi:hypothetical protein
MGSRFCVLFFGGALVDLFMDKKVRISLPSWVR